MNTGVQEQIEPGQCGFISGCGAKCHYCCSVQTALDRKLDSKPGSGIIVCIKWGMAQNSGVTLPGCSSPKPPHKTVVCFMTLQYNRTTGCFDCWFLLTGASETTHVELELGNVAHCCFHTERTMRAWCRLCNTTPYLGTEAESRFVQVVCLLWKTIGIQPPVVCQHGIHQNVKMS